MTRDMDVIKKFLSCRNREEMSKQSLGLAHVKILIFFRLLTDLDGMERKGRARRGPPRCGGESHMHAGMAYVRRRGRDCYRQDDH
jgi:hypothetical protein